MEPLVMVPGLGSDAAVWERTIQALGTAAECRVGDTLSDDSLAGMAARILAAAPSRFSLAGLSMGGMVALEVMRAAPERVTRLALIDTSARPDTPEQAAQRHRTNAAVAATDDFEALVAGSVRYLIHPESPGDVRDAVIAMGVRVGADAYVRQNRAVIARGDQRPVLATITVPTIVLVGADDVMTPLDRSEEIQAGIPGATLQVIPNCGHLSPLEKPEAVAGSLRGWLSKGG